MSLMSTPLFDFLYRFASRQNMVYASYAADFIDVDALLLLLCCVGTDDVGADDGIIS